MPLSQRDRSHGQYVLLLAVLAQLCVCISTSDPKPQMARVHVFRHVCGAHSWLSQALAPTELLAAEARGHLSLAEVGTEEFLKKLTSQITEMVSAKITQGKSGC